MMLVRRRTRRARVAEVPSDVVLGPHRYSIEFVEECSKKRRVGEADRVTNTIRVRNDQSASNLRSTTLHEIAHQAYWLTPIRFMDGWTDDLEEASILAVEPYLLELFTRVENAPLREWLSH